MKEESLKPFSLLSSCVEDEHFLPDTSVIYWLVPKNWEKKAKNNPEMQEADEKQ